MNRNDIQKHLIYTTLTRNSTTLYTTENFQLMHAISNINCSEIIGQELGAISGAKTLVGSIPLTNKKANVELAIYFIKKMFTNTDGSADLIMVVSVAHAHINKTLVLSVLKKIMDKYIEFKQDTDQGDDKSRLGEFKLYMNQIIKFEEMNYDSNSQIYNYGAIGRGDEESAGDVIGPRSLVLVNEEVEEVRQLMLDNIRNLMTRGDKINLLVDQTDRLTSSSSVFRRRTQSIKRRMWFANVKLVLLLVAGAVVLVYIVGTSVCGFPVFNRCIHKGHD